MKVTSVSNNGGYYKDKNEAWHGCKVLDNGVYVDLNNNPLTGEEQASVQETLLVFFNAKEVKQVGKEETTDRVSLPVARLRAMMRQNAEASELLNLGKSEAYILENAEVELEQVEYKKGEVIPGTDSTYADDGYRVTIKIANLDADVKNFLVSSRKAKQIAEMKKSFPELSIQDCKDLLGIA